VDDDVAGKAILLEQKVLFSALLTVPPRRWALFHLVFEVEAQVELTQFFVFLDCGNNLTDVPTLFDCSTLLVIWNLFSSMQLFFSVTECKSLTANILSVQHAKMFFSGSMATTWEGLISFAEVWLKLSRIVQKEILY
jgi:hypothetical protein